MGKVFKWHDDIADRAAKAKNHSEISRFEAHQAVDDREVLIRDYSELKHRYNEIAAAYGELSRANLYGYTEALDNFQENVLEILGRD